VRLDAQPSPDLPRQVGLDADDLFWRPLGEGGIAGVQADVEIAVDLHAPPGAVLRAKARAGPRQPPGGKAGGDHQQRRQRQLGVLARPATGDAEQ